MGLAVVAAMGVGLWFLFGRKASGERLPNGSKLAPLVGIQTKYNAPDSDFETRPGGVYAIKPQATAKLFAQLAARSLVIESVQSDYTHAWLVDKAPRNAMMWVNGETQAGRIVLLTLADPAFELLSVPRADVLKWAMAGTGRAVIAAPAY